MMVGAKVCDLTEDLLWFVCSLYVGILTSSLIPKRYKSCLRFTLYDIFPYLPSHQYNAQQVRYITIFLM